MAGNGPPASLSAADLWLQMTALPRPFRIVDFPRKDANGQPVAQLAIVPINRRESYAATAQAERFVRKILKDEGVGVPSKAEVSEGYQTLYENRAADEILFRACRKSDDVTKPFFPTIEALGDLTTDESGVLFRTYLFVCSEIGPIVSKMSQEEYDAWIDRLVEGGRADPLAVLTVESRNDLVMYMANQLYASRKANSSPGEQPENT